MRPLRRLVDAADDVEHRRLAGAVRTDEPADLPLARCRRSDAVERHDAAEAHRHLLHIEQHVEPFPSLNTPSAYNVAGRPVTGAASSVVPVEDGAHRGLEVFEAERRSWRR